MVLRACWRRAECDSMRSRQSERLYRRQRAPGLPGLQNQHHSREWKLDLEPYANEWHDDFPVWPTRGKYEAPRGPGALASLLGAWEQLRQCSMAGVRRDRLHGKRSGLRWTRAHKNKIYDSRPRLFGWEWIG